METRDLKTLDLRQKQREEENYMQSSVRNLFIPVVLK